jgi:hypothetical protein
MYVSIIKNIRCRWRAEKKIADVSITLPEVLFTVFETLKNHLFCHVNGMTIGPFTFRCLNFVYLQGLAYNFSVRLIPSYIDNLYFATNEVGTQYC